MGKNITALDSTLEINLLVKLNPYLSPLTGVWRPLLVNSVEDMVNKVIRRAGDEQIDSLIISGHGAPGVQAVGCGRSKFWDDDGEKSLRFDMSGDGYLALLASAEKHLKRLETKFSQDAVITLGGCNVAKGDDGKQLLSLVSFATNTFVQGGDATQRILVPGWEGNVIRCYRNTHWVASAALI